ncbi:MAG TPA: ATP-binding cassette domain-containing protein [Propionibacteriaceae bacterium]|jgi:ribose transport system ATP-binding protein
MTESTAPQPIFEVVDVWKAFPGVQALRGASFQGYAGRIHGLVGENGAGKSTLMRIVAGVYQPDRGQIVLDGQPIRHLGPYAAHRAGISMVYQDTRLAPDLDAPHNVWLGHEPVGRFGIIDQRSLVDGAARLLAAFNLPIDLHVPVRDLSAAQRQAIEIAKALSYNAKVLILDEPTAALNVHEVGVLFGVLRDLRARGVSVIFVSHRLPEVLEITDSITVMKDGEVVGTLPTAEASEYELVRMMVGRPVDVVFPARATQPGEPVLTVSGLASPGAFEDISFEVRRGEIMGLGGIEGNGQRELARSLFGVGAIVGGTITLGGQVIRAGSPRGAVARGIAYVSNDRRGESLMLPLSVLENVALPTVEGRSRAGVVLREREGTAVRSVIDEYGIRTPSARSSVEGLSGGNQQKVALGRWTLASLKVVVLDEPTQGVDVASKLEIYERVRRLAAAGVAVILLSSDLIELMGLSDRILVMSNGRIVREVPAAEATEEMIVGAAVTATKNHGATSQAKVHSAPRRLPRVSPTWRTPLLLGVALLVAGAFAMNASQYFLTSDNLANLATAASPLAMAAIGQTLVLLLGGIDLSIGAVMSLTVTVASHVITPTTSPGGMILGVVICLLVGTAVGTANGLIIRYTRLADLVVTLSSLFMVTGLALIVRPYPSGQINGDFIKAMTVTVGSFPVAAIVILAAFLLLQLAMGRTRAGISLIATGSASEASFIAGIRVDRVRVLAYSISGLTASIGGLLLATRVGSGDPNAGASFTLQAVTAVVVGGVSVFGGRGTLIGPLLGAIIVVGIQNVLNLLHVSAYYQYVWIGLLTLAGVAAYSVDWSRLGERLRLRGRPHQAGAS